MLFRMTSVSWQVELLAGKIVSRGKINVVRLCGQRFGGDRPVYLRDRLPTSIPAVYDFDSVETAGLILGCLLCRARSPSAEPGIQSAYRV